MQQGRISIFVSEKIMKWHLSKPYEKIFAYPLVPDVSEYDVIARGPLREERQLAQIPVGWSQNYGIAGAPEALYDSDSDEFWLTYRVAADGPRICELHIAKSKDGKKFTDVNVWDKTVERSALLKDAKTGKFKLYLCTTHTFGLGARRTETPVPVGRRAGGDNFWVICKLDDVEDPRDFDIETMRVVLQPSTSGMDWNYVKDPYIVAVGNRFYMYYIGKDRYEQCFLATSTDGEKWERHPTNPVLSQGGWHDFYTRPGCLVPAGNLFLFYYEGSSKEWIAPVYNIATGLAITFDLERIIDVTPDAPILTSSTPGPTPGGDGINITLRYMDALLLEDRILFYYEAATKEGCNELRVTEVPLST